MSRRKLVAIVLAVVAVHLALFLVIGRQPALPPARYIPPPNFGIHEEIYEDKKTGERTIYRELRVSTKLSPRPEDSAQPPASPPPSAHATHPL